MNRNPNGRQHSNAKGWTPAPESHLSAFDLLQQADCQRELSVAC